jgi:hypothetical protein
MQRALLCRAVRWRILHMAVVSTSERVSTPPADGDAEHMGIMLENARKQTFHNYRAILQDIHEKPSIIAQTYKNPSDGKPVVSLRRLYLCLQCPNIMTEGDRDEHVDLKRHIFCTSS